MIRRVPETEIRTPSAEPRQAAKPATAPTLNIIPTTDILREPTAVNPSSDRRDESDKYERSA